MIKIPENIIQRLKNPKILVILGLSGILLIFFSSLFSGEEQTKIDTTVEITAEEYRLKLQEDIADTVKNITGSRKVNVIVTLDSGLRYTYADTIEETTSDKTESDSQSKGSEMKSGYITVKSPEGGEEALLLSTGMPEIRGVAIVCEGGDNEVLRGKIENAVTAALNITSKRVYICGRN